MKNKNNLKVLFFDIETTPLSAAVWGRYEQNAVWVDDEWYMLNFAAKWGHEKKIMRYSIWDYPRYNKEPSNDIEVVKELHRLVDEADILVAHNGDRFDVKKMNTRFITHGLTPPSPYKTVDTLKVARGKFAFSSNKLDDLGDFLGVGRKVDTGSSAKLWKCTMAGDSKCQKLMDKYVKQDVTLLESVYNKLISWATGVNTHDSDRPDACRRCGSTDFQSRGLTPPTVTGIRYQRYQCKSCGGWCQEKRKTAESGSQLNKAV